MNRDTTSPSARLIQSLLRALTPDGETSVESELLIHFPFARIGEQEMTRPLMRVPTTISGTL